MANEDGSVLVGLGLDPDAVSRLVYDLKKALAKADEEASVKAKLEIDTKRSQQELAKVREDILDVDAALDEIGKNTPVVRIKADPSALQALDAPTKTLRSNLDEISGGVERLELALVAAAAALAGVIGIAAKNASEDEQALSNLKNTLGELTGEAVAYGKSLAESNLAISEGQIQGQIARLSRVGQTYGLTGTAALDFAKNLTTVASNLSLTTGQDFDTVLEKLQRAMIKGGKASAELGINLDQLTIKQRAATLGFGKGGEELDDSTEAQIRYALIMEQTAGAADKAAKTQLTFSQATAQLKTQVGEAFGDLGQQIIKVLRPYVEDLVAVVGAVRTFIQEHEFLGKVTIAAAIGVTGLAVALGTLLFAFKGIASVLTVVEALGKFPAIATAASNASGTLATAVATAGKALLALGPALAVIGAAAAGYALGTAIDQYFGISESAAQAARTVADSNIQMERAGKLGVTAADGNLIAAQSFKALEETAKNSKREIATVSQEAINYAVQLRKQAKDAEEAARFNRVFNASLQEGSTPAQAFAQAINEANRVTALHALGTERSASQEAEYQKLLKSVSHEFLVQTGIIKENSDALEELSNLTEAQQKVLKAATDSAVAAERALEDARVKATKTLDDDIALLKKRAEEEKRTTPDRSGESRDQVDRRTKAQVDLLKFEEEKKAAEDNAKNQEKLDKDREQRTKKLADEAVKAEEDRAEAIVKGTETLEDDLALLEKREQLELQNAENDQQRASIRTKYTIEIGKLLTDVEKKRGEAAKKASEDAARAEDSLADARVASTETIQDDLNLMRQRIAKELELAKTEAERDAIKRKALAQEKLLIEANARARAKDIADNKKALEDFSKSATDKEKIRKGQGSQVDVAETTKRVSEAAGKITGSEDLATFEKGAKAEFGNQRADLEARNAEIEKGIALAQQEFQEKQRAGFASTKEREAAKAALADTVNKGRAEQQQLAIAAQQLAENEKLVASAAAAKALAEDKKKAEEEALAAKTAQAALDAQAGLTPDPAAPGAAAPPTVPGAAPAVPGAEAASPLEEVSEQFKTTVEALTAALGAGLEAVAVNLATFIESANAFVEQAAGLVMVGEALTLVAESQSAFIESLTAFTTQAVETLTQQAAELTAVKETLDEHAAQLAALAQGAQENDERAQAADAGLPA